MVTLLGTVAVNDNYHHYHPQQYFIDRKHVADREPAKYTGNQSPTRQYKLSVVNITNTFHTFVVIFTQIWRKQLEDPIL